MTSRFTELVVNCRDPHGLAGFWREVLGYRTLEERDDQVEITAWEPTVEAVRERAMPPTLLFIRVPEDKAGRNRLHLDVSPVDRGQVEEVERLLALGATRVDVGQGDKPWEVMADPEGNEFCVVRSLAG
jgi:hypothetical protein